MKESSSKEKVKEGKAKFHELFSFADSTDFTLMASGTVSAVGAGLTLPIATVLFGNLVNSFGIFNGDDVKHEVTKVVLQFVYLAIGSGVASSLQVSCWIATGERQAMRIRELYMKSLMRQEIAFYDKEATTGQVIASLSGDIILTQEAIGEKVGKFIHLISMFFGGFIIAVIRGWHLALILIACIPFIAITGAVMSMLTLRFSVRGQLRCAEASSMIEETMGFIRTVASFSGESQAMETYDKLIRSTYKSAVLEGVVNGLGIGAILMFSFCSYGLAIWYGSELVINKGYTGGEVINVMLAIMTGSMSLGQASPCIRAFSAGQVAAHKIFEVIRRKSVVDIYDMSGAVLEDLKGDIELRDIYFSYPTRPDQMIFEGFSLQVRSGTTMALIGESGSGKSTVVSLVERFYDPQAGEVLIDGFNMKNLRLSWIRKKISLVSQEPVLFMTTIKDNIMYGKEDASAEEISRVLNLANVDKFINNMSCGLETMVGEHGTQLSGGQKQRIAIARAILRNPKILLLDEATSALDLESESIVHDALLNIMTDRTTIIVAHRLTTVKNADTISVLHKGRLIEQGSHSELIENVGGAYSQMVRLQDLTNVCEAEPSPSVNEMSPFKVIRKHTKQRSLSRVSSSRGSNSQVESCADDSQEIYVGNHEKNEEKKGAFILRLIRLNKPEIPALLAGTAAAAVNGVIFPVYGILLSSVIKTYYEPPHQLQKDAKFWALMHVLLGAVGFVVIPWQHYCFGVAGGRLVERIRSLLFRTTVHQEISWFDDPENSSGAISARLSRDASLLRNLVGDTLSFMVQNSSTVICGLAIAFAANWKLAFVILACIPLIGLQAYVQVKFLRGFSADAKVLYEEATQMASEAVGGIRTVASFCAEEKVMIACRRKCELPMRHGIQKGLISGLGYGFSSLTLYCTYALCFYVGARFVQDGSTNPAQLFRVQFHINLSFKMLIPLNLVFFALMMTAIGVSETSAHGLDAAKAKESAAAIFSVLDRKSKIDAAVENGIVLADCKGEIEFQHVRFSYPSRPQVKIFTDLCIRMPSGKSVALVGESGGGKSTLINLIQRFSDPDSGTILIDGVEIRDLKLSWLRQQMGLVSQEPVLFRGSIRSNIAYGKSGGAAPSEDEIIAAGKAANAHDFISSLSDGYDTNVGERGAQLSGGQKQRIAIARAVIRNPRILLLDEATSALDAESEHVVQEALERVMLGRTTICIAHRLSTIQTADTIAVVKDGVIAEMGQHQALMSIAGGAYASLVSLHMAH